MEVALNVFLALKPLVDSPRILSSRIMCSVAFEHAESVKILIASGNFTSGVGMLRLQYEALVKAMWLTFAAPDSAVSTLIGELTQDEAKRAEKLPNTSQILKNLEETAPAEALAMLREFQEYSWKPLNSYVHGGVHAMHRHSKGYPKGLLEHALKASNGLSTLVGMLLVILSGDRMQTGKMPKIQVDFADCLPEVKKV